MIEHLSTRAAHPTLRRSILPRTPNRRAQRLQITGFQEAQHISAELSVMIEQNVSTRARQRKCIPELLHDPIACWMERNVEMQNASAIMFNGEEAIQGAEPKVRNGEEVECGNRFAMVVQKSEPLAGFAFVRKALQPLQITRHGRFGDLEAQ